MDQLWALFLLVGFAHSSSITLETKLGRIQGRHVTSRGLDPSKSYFEFKSIPYALPPVGSRRFKPPQLAREWVGGEHNGAKDPPVCPQLENNTVIGDEDCLVLNIFTPSSVVGQLPVMVYVHGGGFVVGSSSEYGADLLVEKDVILVTLNYRLGVLGFYGLMNATAPGNLGLRDIMVALDWIQENIEEYGGDKSQVTIFGHSAGSMAISALLTNQQAKFNRAILQAGTLVRPFFKLLSKTNLTKVNYEFSEKFNCSGNSTVTCMQSISVENLVHQTFFKPVHTIWEPTLDDKLDNSVFPLDPLQAILNGNFKDVDLIIGSSSGDGIAQLGGNVLSNSTDYDYLQKNFKTKGPSLMLGRQEPDAEDLVLAEQLRYFYTGESVLNSSIDKQMVELMSDNMYETGGRSMLEILSFVSEKNHYQYLFDYVGTNTYTNILYNLSRPDLGACHGDILFYLFTGKEDNLITDSDKMISSMLVEYWTNFAKSGNVNSVDTETKWDSFTMESQKFLQISSDSQMASADVKKLQFWRNFLELPPVTESSAGLLQGSYRTSTKGKCILSYQGVPYAKPPMKRLRFMDPVEADPWQGVLDATSEPPKCLQFTEDYGLSEKMSEDCLFLNIYTPCALDESSSLPVMFWIHGGDYMYGGGGTEFYGPEYLVDEGVILVTVQYRLAPFGFISLESSVMPGNQGLKDQKLALSWVQDHIASLGGNKDEVTLFGENAGSESVLNHMSNIFSEGLFSKVIAHGNAPATLVPGLQPRDGHMRRNVLQLADNVNCNRDENDREILSCLQDASANQILAKQLNPYGFGPTNDHLISTTPFFYTTAENSFYKGIFNKVPLIAGFNAEDGINRAFKFINNASLLDTLNSNWNVYGAEQIFGKCCEFSDLEVDIANEIREYYFGDENITLSNIQNLISLFSDQPRSGIHRLLKFSSKYSPSYEYLFNYTGSFSFSNLLVENSTDLGVTEGDEFQYLFNMHFIEFPTLRNEADMTVRDAMVKMWTSFAKTSNPNFDEATFDWNQFDLSSPEYLEISEYPAMANKADVLERISFWEETFLTDPRVTLPEVTTYMGSWDKTEKGDKFKSFKGIKYGKVSQRFQEASALEEHDLDTIAQAEGKKCPQVPYNSDMAEECLFLNIYTPREANNASVMVYIHGGGYQVGSGGQHLLAPQFIMDYDVIMVTLNYRLGPFGFLSLESSTMPGNIGFRDQVLALEWIKNNIVYFGGNANDITIFGESAGSFSVMYQVLSPLSTGLFTKAIAQSGAPFSTYIHSSDHGKQRKIALSMANQFNCSSGNDYEILACLEEQSVESILSSQYVCTNESLICTFNLWDAVVDYYSENPFLPNEPDILVNIGEYAKIPMIIGVNSEEGIFSAADYIKDPSKFSYINDNWDYTGPMIIFDKENPTPIDQARANVVKEFYLGDKNASMETIHEVIDLYSDTIFWVGPHRFTMRASNQADIFTYQLTYKSQNSYADIFLGVNSTEYGLGVCHADDLFHIFKNDLRLTYSETDLVVRDMMLTWWTNFAKTGRPSLDGSWAPFKPNEPAYMEIKPEPAMAYSDRYRERMDFWSDFMDGKLE